MAEEMARASHVADGAGESHVAHRASNLPIGGGTALGGLFQAMAAIYNTHQQIKWEERALISDQESKRAAASTRFSRELLSE